MKHPETSEPQKQTETPSRWPALPTGNRWAQFENGSNRSSNPPTKPRVSSTYPRPVDPDGDKATALAFTEGRWIYVGNLPYIAKREDVEDLAIVFAIAEPDPFTSEKIDISIDPFTGRNPSYCFVNMESKEAAEDAITYLNGKNVLGRPVKIKMGVPKAQRPPPFGRRDPTTGDAPELFVFDRWSRDNAQEHWGKYAPSGRV